MENTTPTVVTTIDTVTLEQIKIIELIHIVANLLSGGILGIAGVATYMLMNKEIKPEAKSICYDIINFNLSFIIYFLLGFLAIFVIVGLFILPVLWIAWIILMIIGAVKHFAGERYTYPMVIQFIK